MNNITTFNNPAFGSVRAVSVNDEPYFVGKDVAEILGYSNSRDALSKHAVQARRHWSYGELGAKTERRHQNDKRIFNDCRSTGACPAFRGGSGS